MYWRRVCCHPEVEVSDHAVIGHEPTLDGCNRIFAPHRRRLLEACACGIRRPHSRRRSLTSHFPPLQDPQGSCPRVACHSAREGMRPVGFRLLCHHKFSWPVGWRAAYQTPFGSFLPCPGFQAAFCGTPSPKSGPLSDRPRPLPCCPAPASAPWPATRALSCADRE
jgi:hypothetical protein